jgi:surfactin synthase thioesterase subunit
MMEFLLPIIRADLEVVETYDHLPGYPLACPIVAMGGTSDPRVGIDDLDGWECQTTGNFCRHIFPGNHFFLLDALTPVTQTIIKHLRNHLGSSVRESLFADGLTERI